MYRKRVEKLVTGFDAQGIDALLIQCAPNMSLNPNIFYLTGFMGSSAYLIITPAVRYFLTDSRYIEKATAVIHHFDIIDFTGKKLPDVIKDLLQKCDVNKLGIEASHMSVSTFNKYTEHFAPIKLVPTVNLVEALRTIKDEHELSLMREAIRINEESFVHILNFVKDGVTERELAAEFEYAIRKRGGEMSSFSPIIASGCNSSMPHAGFTDQVLVPDAPIKFDIGVLKNGYCSDMTRTVFFKSCTEIWEKRYYAVLEGKRAAERVVKAGVTGNEVDAAARKTIIDLGFADHIYSHGLGHAIGIDVHEPPVFAFGAECIIPAGAVLSVEPGIYVPGEGGIRIEDLVHVTEDGCENLNNLDCDLRIIG
jgi:Xaa-Pro aminopeptidase